VLSNTAYHCTTCRYMDEEMYEKHPCTASTKQSEGSTRGKRVGINYTLWDEVRTLKLPLWGLWNCHAIWTQLISWSGKNVMVIISNWGHVNSSYLLQVKWWWLDSFGQHTSTFQCLEYADLKHHEAKKHIGLKWNAWYSPNINLWFENWPTSPGLHFQCFVFLIWGTIHNTHATLIWMVLLWACNKGFFFNFVTGRKWWSPIRWSS
jgi:hypothetical protein